MVKEATCQVYLSESILFTLSSPDPLACRVVISNHLFILPQPWLECRERAVICQVKTWQTYLPLCLFPIPAGILFRSSWSAQWLEVFCSMSMRSLSWHELQRCHDTTRGKIYRPVIHRLAYSWVIRTVYFSHGLIVYCWNWPFILDWINAVAKRPQ